MSKSVDYAQRMLMEYWDKESIPIIPEKIIDALRNSMDKPDIFVKIEPMVGNISGQIEYDHDKLMYVITINSERHPHHQRFTLAHELGHYALSHGEKYDNQVVLNRDGGSDPDEVAANAFAAELLMPKAIVKHLIFEQKIFDLQELARRFWVSESAMFYRLKNLGYL